MEVKIKLQMIYFFEYWVLNWILGTLKYDTRSFSRVNKISLMNMSNSNIKAYWTIIEL